MCKIFIAFLLLALPCVALAKEKEPDTSRDSKNETIKQEKSYCYEYFDAHVDKWIIEGKEQLAKGSCYNAYQAFKRLAYNTASPPSECKKSTGWYDSMLDRAEYARVMVSELSKSCPQVAGEPPVGSEGGAEIVKELDGSLRIQKKRP